MRMSDGFDGFPSQVSLEEVVPCTDTNGASSPLCRVGVNRPLVVLG